MFFSVLFSVFLISGNSFASHYPTSYEDSLNHFNQQVERIKDIYPEVESRTLLVPTNTQQRLSIDTLYIPQKDGKKERLLILTSGVHGVEAYTGAAIQFEYLDNIWNKKLNKHMGLLIIHTINPYGSHFQRRVTENNIDLNRNFSAKQQNFERRIDGYENFDPFLNPKVPVQSGALSTVTKFVKAIYKLLTYGRKQLAQIAIGGQYQNPKGIYFGGQATEPNVDLVRAEFQKVGLLYEKVLHLDLHTGYGARGQLHFFTSHKTSKLEGFDQLFEGFHLDMGSDDDFYETSGSIDQFTVQTFEGQKVIPMTLEFGTMDSQTTMGGFYSLQNMIDENQGIQFGYASNQTKETITQNFLEMFNPSDEEWRTSIMLQAKEALTKISTRFSSN